MLSALLTITSHPIGRNTHGWKSSRLMFHPLLWSPHSDLRGPRRPSYGTGMLPSTDVILADELRITLTYRRCVTEGQLPLPRQFRIASVLKVRTMLHPARRSCSCVSSVRRGTLNICPGEGLFIQVCDFLPASVIPQFSFSTHAIYPVSLCIRH